MTEIKQNIVSQPVWVNADWYLDTRRNILTSAGKTFEIENQLFVLLDYFVAHKQQILSKDQLLKDNWPGKVVNEDSLTVAVSKLRKVFGDHSKQPAFIKTVPGVGYQFIASIHPVKPTKVLPWQQQSKGFTTFWPFFVATLLMSWLALPLFLSGSRSNDSADTTHTSPNVVTQPYQKLVKQSEAPEPADIADLIDQWRAVLVRNPDLAKGYWYLALLKVTLLGDALPEQPQHFDELNALLQKSLSLDPEQPEAWSWLAKIHFWHQHDYAQAAAYFEKALQLKEDAGFYYAYGQLLLAQGQFDETIEMANKARHIMPQLFAFPGLAWAYQLSGQSVEAWQELQRISQTERQSELWHRSTLKIAYELGLYEQSFDSLHWLLAQTAEGRSHLPAVEQLYPSEGIKSVYAYLLTAQFSNDIGHYHPPLSFARYAILSKNYQAALDYFQQAVAKRQVPLLWAGVDSLYTPIHHSQEFKGWLKTLKLAGPLRPNEIPQQ